MGFANVRAGTWYYSRVEPPLELEPLEVCDAGEQHDDRARQAGDVHHRQDAGLCHRNWSVKIRGAVPQKLEC